MCFVDRNYILVKMYFVGGVLERIIFGMILIEVIKSVLVLVDKVKVFLGEQLFD